MGAVAAQSQPSRRAVLKCAAGVAGSVGIMGRVQRMKQNTFVLVHPAWHGAWCWKKVVPLLRERRHSVFTPTLTGLGERSHLARADIGLDIHVDDVVNVLRYEDLRDVVLVGHSSSGAVITGVADRAPERIGRVIYVDAFVPEDGQAVLDLVAPERRQMFEAMVKNEGDGWLVPRFAPPPWETIVRDMWGVTDDSDVKWMLERLVPTPVGHFTVPVRRTNAAAEKLPRAYVRCTRYANPRFDWHAEMARRSERWQYRELSVGHHPAVTVPDTLVDLLVELGSL
jgi:pimeloyl-ACP methyl ester carboxylesterase